MIQPVLALGRQTIRCVTHDECCMHSVYDQELPVLTVKSSSDPTYKLVNNQGV